MNITGSSFNFMRFMEFIHKFLFFGLVVCRDVEECEDAKAKPQGRSLKTHLSNGDTDESIMIVSFNPS